MPEEWSKKAFDSFYSSHFSRLNVASKEEFDNAAKVYGFWYKRFLPQKRDARILDIGCGMGQFLYFLKKEGYTNAIGIDVSKEQVDFARDFGEFNVILANAFDFLPKNKGFDAIVGNDIIEHIPREKLLTFLELIYDSLSPGGKVILKTGNMSNPFGLQARYIDITHETGFTEHSLQQVLGVAGFRDVIINGDYRPNATFKLILNNLAESFLHYLIKFGYLVQGYSTPKILAKNLIAIGKKIE